MSCDKVQARWALRDAVPEEGEDEIYALCSLCFLYESNWGLNRQEEIEVLIKDVENRQDRAFIRTKNGRLLAPKDADQVLGSIALVSRIFEMRRKEGLKAMGDKKKLKELLKK
jgi:hypothetical protein